MRPEWTYDWTNSKIMFPYLKIDFLAISLVDNFSFATALRL